MMCDELQTAIAHADSEYNIKKLRIEQTVGQLLLNMKALENEVSAQTKCVSNQSFNPVTKKPDDNISSATIDLHATKVG